MHLGELEQVGTILLDTQLAGICKATNPGASFVFWLNPEERTQGRVLALASAEKLRQFSVCLLICCFFN